MFGFAPQTVAWCNISTSSPSSVKIMGSWYTYYLCKQVQGPMYNNEHKRRGRKMTAYRKQNAITNIQYAIGREREKEASGGLSCLFILCVCLSEPEYFIVRNYVCMCVCVCLCGFNGCLLMLNNAMLYNNMRCLTATLVDQMNEWMNVCLCVYSHRWMAMHYISSCS